MLLWATYGEQWAENHKVTFDGPNRQIIVGEFVDEINIQADIYSSWKEWVRLYDNAKYLPAVRTIGGDPAGDGFAGDLYFMVNNWQIVVPNFIRVNGILYSDNFDTPYIVLDGGGVVASVSNLAYAVATAAAITPPSADAIATEIMSRLQESLDMLQTLSLESSVQAAIKAAKTAAALSA